MMSSLWPSVAICLSYVLIVTVIGPKLMENRKPMEIKGLMIGYNFSMVAFCGYIMYEVIMCDYNGLITSLQLLLFWCKVKLPRPPE